MTTIVPSSSGILTIPVLNVNFLYIQGQPFVDFSGNISFLQQEIDALDAEVTSLQQVVSRINLTGLTGNLVITDANKNEALLTAIQALQQSVGNINKLDLSALPNAPPASCIITTTTTNQALKSLIDTNTSNISTLTTKVTDLSNNVTTLQNQVATINTNITALNAKTAHLTVYTVAGGTVMTGIRDNTGFAVDMSADDSSNGLFVYPNGDGHNAQIRLETAQDKQLYMRGGSAVTLYAGGNGSITSRNAIFIGDVTDNIKIGSFTSQTQYPLIEIGDPGVGLLPSTTRIKGDVYLSQNAVTSIYDQLVYASGNPTSVGKLNNTTAPFLSGLTVTTVAGFPLVSITQLFGAITFTTGAGLISLITGVGGINMTCGGGAVTINTGGGAMSIACGAGVLNMASGTGTSNWTTANGDIYLGAGKGTGGSAGNVSINSIGNISLTPDLSCNINKTEYIEMNSYPTAPATTTRRIYDISGNLYYNGSALAGGGGGSQYVLKAGDTMTGTLVTPAVTTPSITSTTDFTVTPTTAGNYNKTAYIEFNDNASAPPVTANRLYQQANQLYFDGTALGGGGSQYVLKAGDTMTGTLVTPQVTTPIVASTVGSVSVPSIVLQPAVESYTEIAGNYADGGASLRVRNTRASANTGATVILSNDKTGAGVTAERCGSILFTGKDTASVANRSYVRIAGHIADATSTSTDGRLSTSIAVNNSMTEVHRLSSSTTGSIRRCDIGCNYTEIGPTAIGSSATSTLTVNGTANIVTSLQTPLISNALNIYPATSSTLVDNAVRQYQPERLYKLNTYPEPLGPPTRDGEKVYFVNPTGTPSTSLDKLLAFTDFQSIPSFTGNFTWEYIQKSVFYKGSSVTGGNDAWYYSCKFNDGNSYIFVYVDFDGQVWKLYGVAKIYGEVNDMCVGNPAFGGGGINHRIYLGGSFATGDTASGTNGVILNNVCGINIQYNSGGINQIGFRQMDSANDPAVPHELPFTGIIGVSGVVNCIVNASGLNQFGLSTNEDIIVIGGQFYQIGASGGNFYRGLASIAWYNMLYTSGLQTDMIGWSTLDNNQRSTEPYVGVGTSSQGESVLGVGFWSDGWGAMVYTGTIYNDQNGTGVTNNYLVYFYHSNGSVAFQSPASDAQFIETGQTFPKENQYNQTNIIKGGSPSGGTAQYGDFTFETLAITNGLTPTGGSNWGINWRPTSNDPYQNTLCLVIDNQAVNPARQPLTQFGALQIVGFYSNQTVYPDEYFLGTFLSGVYEGYRISAPFNNPNYTSISLGATIAPIRSFASYSTILGYTGLNMYGNSTGQDGGGCVWIYKTTQAGDLTVELSGCLVRTSPNIYATDTITFLGVSDGSSLMLLGDTSTTGNPQGKPSWWAISQDGAIKYDNTTVDSGGINSIVAGTGISEVTNAGSVTISNTGVTSIVAGTGVTISSTGTGGTGAVTINASVTGSNGWLKGRFPLLSMNNQINDTVTYLPVQTSLDFMNTFKTGLGVNFDENGGGSGQFIRYTGTGWVMVTITLNVGVSVFSSATSNWTNLLTYSNGTFQLSNFGLRIYVVDANGNQTQYNPDTYNWFLGSSNAYSNGTTMTSSPPLYENTVSYSCLLTTNSYIYLAYMCNQYFNQSGGGHQSGDLSATFTKSYFTLTIHETGAPDHT